MSIERYYERIDYDINTLRPVRLIYDRIEKTWEIHPLPTREEIFGEERKNKRMLLTTIILAICNILEGN